MLVRLLSNAAMAVLFGLAAVMLVPAALGYHRYVIQTGSMTGTYDAGSIVYDRPVPTASLRVGDPITYAPPPGASPSHKLVTHRIYRIAIAPDGRRVFQTKGDFNLLPDNWRFVLPQPTQDEVKFHVPYLGYAFELLSVPRYRKLLIGVPAVLVAMWVVAGLWKEGGEAQRRRERGVVPWGEDVARALPALAPAVADGSAPPLRAVRVAARWPRPDPPRRATAPPARRLPAQRVQPRTLVALPAGCVARPARRRAAERRSLPPDWRLAIRRRGG